MTKAKPMPARTLKALKASIEHWKRNEVGIYDGIHSEQCPLCELFIRRNGDCFGCPVQAKTEKQECRGTPWLRVYDASDDIYSKRFKDAAKRMRVFLESLLPKGEKA